MLLVTATIDFWHPTGHLDQLQHSLYRYFAVIGGALEVATIIAAVVFALRAVSVEQHLAGVGGWLLGAAHRDQAANMRAMAPMAVQRTGGHPGALGPRLGSSPETPLR